MSSCRYIWLYTTQIFSPWSVQGFRRYQQSTYFRTISGPAIAPPVLYIFWRFLYHVVGILNANPNPQELTQCAKRLGCYSWNTYGAYGVCHPAVACSNLGIFGWSWGLSVALINGNSSYIVPQGIAQREDHNYSNSGSTPFYPSISHFLYHILPQLIPEFDEAVALKNTFQENILVWL